MGIKHVAASVAAAAATLIAAEASAQEITAPMTKFFVAIPLDARNAKEQMPNFGLQFQGSRPYESVKLDYNTFKLLPAVAAGIEAKWIIAGAVALGGAVALTHKDKSTSQSFQQQQQDQRQACPTQTC